MADPRHASGRPVSSNSSRVKFNLIKSSMVEKGLERKRLTYSLDIKSINTKHP